MSANSNTPVSVREKVGERVTIYKRGKSWWVSYQLDRKQQREPLATESKKEARRKALIIEAELLQGKRETTLPPVLITEAIDEYLAFLKTEGRAEKTLNKYRYVLNKFAALAITQRKTSLHQLNLRMIDAYRKLRTEEKRSAKTIHCDTYIIRQLVNFALSRKMISKDPLEGLKNPQPKRTEQPCWTPDEVVQILEAANEPQKSIFTAYADTGMRFGELQWLTWEDVDFEKNLIHIRPKDGWKPKTGESRNVRMTKRLKRVLQNQPRKFRWVFTAPPSTKYPNGGNQISERRLLKSLKRLLKRIGLPPAGKLHTF
ncbi:MAG: tyrosine-type recombinase/integrase, partial [Planctomicrobium sp.]|nr:tyrosine-type recombinase/integrase [Planctomicrobium sp.]